MRYLACAFLTLLFCSSVSAYELTIIQTVSESGHTFITRSGKQDGIYPGKKSTFTSENISILAKALKVTRDFTQWRIINRQTAVPFTKGQVVTMYDATEYLWALSPEEVKSKYIKSEVFEPRFSLEAHLSLFRGLTASVSETADTPDQRGGLVFEGLMEKEFTKHLALAGGFRYSREIISVAAASLTTNQVLGIVEARYYFGRIPAFYNSRFSFVLGAGYGQSQTTAASQASTGNVAILPITKISLNVPVNKNTEFIVNSAFESVSAQEEFEDNSSQSTTTSNFRYGVAIRRYLF